MVNFLYSMAYFLSLFSPETYEAFSTSSRDTTGFRKRQENAAKRVKPGDKLVCYITKLSRWVGILEITDTYFQDDSPIFQDKDDPFVIRFIVNPVAWLEKEKAIPVHNEEVWNTLSFTKGYNQNSSNWTGKIRSSLNQFEDSDGQFLETLILRQANIGEDFPLDEKDYAKLTTHKVRAADKLVTVSVPEEDEGETEVSPKIRQEVRESIKIQALLARIGAEMGMKIWLPKSDREPFWESGSATTAQSLTIYR